VNIYIHFHRHRRFYDFSTTLAIFRGTFMTLVLRHMTPPWAMPSALKSQTRKLLRFFPHFAAT
jgi:hypothetical protein